MSQFFKLNKKNTVNEQTQQPSINPAADKGDQHAAPSLKQVGVYSEQTTQKVNVCLVQIEPTLLLVYI